MSRLLGIDSMSQVEEHQYPELVGKVLTEKTMYRIRRLSDGLFSKGGLEPDFTSMGKAWTKGHLKSHLKMFHSKKSSCSPYRSYQNGTCAYCWPYDNCEIVEFKVTELEKRRISWEDI